MKTNLFVLLLAWLLSASYSDVGADELIRRAAWQAKFNKTPGVGVEVLEMLPGSALAEAGILDGDVLLSVNDTLVDSPSAWADVSDALVAGVVQRILYRRGNETTEVDVTFSAVEKESYDNLDVFYDSIVNDSGIRQRLIITRPKGTTDPLPAIFLVQGLSCSSIEYTPGRKSNFIRSIRKVAAGSGMVLMRVEKPGLGDSEGDCSKTDFHTELNGYETAINRLKSLPYVDPDRIVVWGSSMGSALAPFLATRHKLNGVISDGTFFRSWFEHMLEIERRIKTMQGIDQASLNQQMTQAYIPLYYGMLVEKQSYRSLIEKNPLLAEYNYHGMEHMYGRPMAYYHQVQEFNFAGAWEAVKVPVRVRWGTNDWIMSEADIDMIAQVLQAARHEDFKVHKYPGLDHWDTIHVSAKDSFTGKPGKWDDGISQQIIGWAREINERANLKTYAGG